MNKKVLYLGVHCYSSPLQVGSHAILREFHCRGWQVLYVCAPLTPFHLFKLFDPLIRTRFTELLFSKTEVKKNLNCIVPFSMIAPQIFPSFNSFWVFNNWYKFSIPNVFQKIKQYGFDDVDVLFMDTIFQPNWLNLVNYSKCVTRLSDVNSGFSNFSSAAKKSQHEILINSDLIVSSSLRQKKELDDKFSNICVHIPNGVDLKMFGKKLNKPKYYSNLSKPIAVFSGFPGHWFDMVLVNKTALRFPHIEFVMIGPFSKKLRRSSPVNVHFIGVLPHQELPAYLQHADVGIIPFRLDARESFVDYIHPLKLYEYLASSLPVVSTFWEELAQINSPALLAHSEDEFAEKIEVALSKSVSSALTKTQTFELNASDWRIRLAPLFQQL